MISSVMVRLMKRKCVIQVRFRIPVINYFPIFLKCSTYVSSKNDSALNQNLIHPNTVPFGDTAYTEKKAVLD